MTNRLAILAALLMAGCSPAYALNVTVQAGTAISNIQVAITATTTAAPPHTITVMPGWYPLFDNTKLTSGVIRSISGELNGYGSATDTLCGTNAGGATELYVPSAGTIQGIGFGRLYGRLISGGSSIDNMFERCRFTEIIAPSVYGSVAHSGGSFIGCEFIKCTGCDVLVNAPIVWGCVFIGCEGQSTYSSIIRGDNSTRPYLIESCTFVASKSAGNNGLVNSYNSTTMVMRNNSLTYTNVLSVNWGGTVPFNAGGNVSNGATFYNPPVGYGTNAVIANADLRLVPNCAAWASGVFTNAAWYSASSNTGYDFRGNWYRGVTNTSSGAIWSQSDPMSYPQFFGGILP